MLDVFWQRLDAGARLTLPFITTVICVLLSVIAWPLPHLGAVAPPLGLVALYYWSIHRPDLFRPWMAFAVGLLNDAVNMLPIGLSALLFVGAHQLVLSQRRFFAGHTFFMMWFGFILMIFIIMLAEWLGFCLIHFQLYPVASVLTQMLLVIILFPLPCWLLIRLQRAALSHL